MGLSSETFLSITSKYEIGKTIGRGCFSKVKFGVVKGTSDMVAIKMIRRTESDVSVSKGWRKQIDAMSKLNHENIIKLYEYFESENFMFMVMEYAENGSLTEYFANVKIRFTQEEAKRKFRQVVLAVRHCHMKGIVHRDLKISNLVLDGNYNVKLADFGFSTEVQQGKLLESFCGTPMFAPPEIFESVPYDGCKVDVWSLGVILYRFVTGTLPFDGCDFSTLKLQVKTSKPIMPPFLHPLCRDLLKGMMCKNPNERLDIEDVVQHSWFDSIVPYEQEFVDLSSKGGTASDIPAQLFNDKSNVHNSGLSQNQDQKKPTTSQKSEIDILSPSQLTAEREIEELRTCRGRTCYPFMIYFKALGNRLMLDFINKYFSKSAVRSSNLVYREIRYPPNIFRNTEEVVTKIMNACNRKSVHCLLASKKILACRQNPEEHSFFMFANWEVHVNSPSIWNLNYAIRFYHLDGHFRFLDEFVECVVDTIDSKLL